MLNRTKIDEGILDFIKGSSRSVGQSVAQSAPVQFGKQVYQAGKAESAKADAFAMLIKLAKVEMELHKLKTKASQTGTVQNDANRQVQSQTQPQTLAQPQVQPQAQTSAQPQAQRPSFSSGGVKPSTVSYNFKPGQQMTFNSYIQQVYGDQSQLNEGLGAFVSGAAKAVGSKVIQKLADYGNRDNWVKDAYRAGQAASANADKARFDKQIEILTRQRNELVAQTKQALAPYVNDPQFQNHAKSTMRGIPDYIQRIVIGLIR